MQLCECAVAVPQLVEKLQIDGKAFQWHLPIQFWASRLHSMRTQAPGKSILELVLTGHQKVLYIVALQSTKTEPYGQENLWCFVAFELRNNRSCPILLSTKSTCPFRYIVYD